MTPDQKRKLEEMAGHLAIDGVSPRGFQTYEARYFQILRGAQAAWEMREAEIAGLKEKYERLSEWAIGARDKVRDQSDQLMKVEQRVAEAVRADRERIIAAGGVEWSAEPSSLFQIILNPPEKR